MRKYFKKVKKNQVEDFHTIEELISIFKVIDDRTIKAAFGEELAIVDGTLVLESKYLVKRLGFDPKEPFMTRKEVMAELGVSFAQFTRLVRKGMLPTFKMVQARGSSILLVRRDVENLKKTLLTYNNSSDLLIDHRNKLRHVLDGMLTYDWKHLKLISAKQREYQIFRLHLIENKNHDEIAAEVGVNKETVRNAINRCTTRFDKFFGEIEQLTDGFEKLQKENKQLQMHNSALQIELNHLNEYIGVNKPEAAQELENLLDQELISFLNIISEVSIYDLPISVRLKNVMSTMVQYWRLNYPSVPQEQMSKLKFLIEIPINSLFSIRGMGIKTRVEFEQVLHLHGLTPNLSQKKIELTAGNILHHIRDKRTAWEFYNQKKAELYGAQRANK